MVSDPDLERSRSSKTGFARNQNGVCCLLPSTYPTAQCVSAAKQARFLPICRQKDRLWVAGSPQSGGLLSAVQGASPLASKSVCKMEGAGSDDRGVARAASGGNQGCK
jgi:hypothetical protein